MGWFSAAGASGFPAVGVRLVPWLDSVEEVGFGSSTFLFCEADGGVTQSSLDFPDGILIGCEVHEYQRLIVDANVIGVLPREVAQQAMVLTNSFHGVSSRDVGKESPQLVYVY